MKTERAAVSIVTLAFLIAASIVGLALVPALVLRSNLPSFRVSIGFELIGVLYIAICALGIFAVFYPAKCKSMFQNSQNPISQIDKPSTVLAIRGHHPDCKKFSANIIQIWGRTVCTSCSGLLVGAFIASVGAALYFVAGLGIAGGSGSVWLLALGEVSMLLGLAQIKFAGYVKVIMNLAFVVGSFVTLVETDLLGGSMIIDSYVLGLVAFMLWLRIMLSEWNNARTCQACQSCFQ